jgi:hypothetical protein
VYLASGGSLPICKQREIQRDDHGEQIRDRHLTPLWWGRASFPKNIAPGAAGRTAIFLAEC